ncbi:MAG TPA: UbiA prenyltransferase family protein [Candidatus Limnocylindria bacterium]|nr:UbiA prenyltransferase family protein [Candidatus Limnocylindria bacterium]
MRAPAIVRLLRPQQWTKNLACMAGVVFGGRLGEPAAVLLDVAVTVTFVLAAAAVYVVNDLLDVASDRQHPVKCLRPLAAGEVSMPTAAALAAGLAVAASAAAVALGVGAAACMAVYVALNVLYSLGLKHVAVLDVCCIAMGYVLRVLAGVVVLGDVPTGWILLCTFFLALFLAFTKRRAELTDPARSGSEQRPVLDAYDRATLDSLVDSSATMAVMSYALFTATSGKNPSLIVTVPIVYYAVMHYRRLVLRSDLAQEPDRLLLQDRTLQACIVLWLAAFVAIFYGHWTLVR